MIAYLGDSIGLTLTLAGVTGLIVSVGVTVDSYVVYFERLKDEVRAGRTVRSSVDRGFTRSFRTILAADLVSLIGAAVLYFLAIGSVRGFAFFLGLATILDLIVAYFFMHPAGVAHGASSRARAHEGRRHRLGARRRGGDRMTATADPEAPTGSARRPGRHLPRAHQLRLRRPLVALGADLRQRGGPVSSPRSLLSGLNLGIDFEGGTQWQLTVAEGSASATDVRDALEAAGVDDAKVLILGDDGVRVQAEELGDGAAAEVTTALAEYGGIGGGTGLA